MTAPSPLFTINGSSPSAGSVRIAATTAITCTLVSTTGVKSVAWRISSTDETTSDASYTIIQTGSVGETASFTSLTPGTAALVEAKINGGVDSQTGLQSDDTVFTGKFYVAVAGAQAVEVGCAGEQYEANPTYGSTGNLNTLIRPAGSGSNALTDATVTVVAAYTVPTSTCVSLMGRLNILKSDNSVGSGFGIVGTFRNAGGTVTQVGTTTALWTHEDNAATACDFNVSGAIVRLRVTGLAATTMADAGQILLLNKVP